MVSELPAECRLTVEKEIYIKASLETVWESLLEQIGPGFDRPDGVKMPMVLENWPGGRYYRDLGNNAGHFWGHVQVIKPPTLVEIVGPMFMSYPVMSHVRYHLSEQNGSTLLALTHRAIGDIDPHHREGVKIGWGHILEGVERRATSKTTRII